MSVRTDRMRVARGGAIAAAAALVLTGCAGWPEPSTPTAAPLPAPAERPEPSDTAKPDPGLEGFLLPSGEVEPIVTGLAAPWSVVPLDSGSVLISERDSARIHEVTPDGGVRDLVTVPGVVPGGEGGLLGLAVHDDTLFIYFTAADDNRVLSGPLTGAPGALEVGELAEVITGIPK
ncbi:MAG: PQQ-dependent sugar dehydrogenase, partial [Microcella sp.]